MNVLLVGATGFVGRHLLRALSGAGHHIIATSRTRQPLRLPGVEWRQLDLDELATVPDHFAFPESIDLLINAAGVLSVDEQQSNLTQDLGSRALFDLAKSAGVRVLHISALGAGVRSDVHFLTSKAAADDYLIALGLPAVVLRPSLVVGPGGASSAWLARMSALPVIPLLDRKALLQPLHVDDLVSAILALMRRWPAEPMVLPVVGTEVMTLAQLIDQMRMSQGWSGAWFIKIPDALALFGASLGDRFGWRALNGQTLRMAHRDSMADPEVLESVCGYRCAGLRDRLKQWPDPAQSTQLALRPLMLATLVLIWLGTAFVSLWPGFEWGLRILSEGGLTGPFAQIAVVAGALCDGLLGLGMLMGRWRRRVLQLQVCLMTAYTLIITFVLPHYWFDPYASVAKNLVLIVATLWLLRTEPRR
ncbi:SDR family oxidoreductase [Pseudomonas sp. LP_7_YM]|uniref:SDR family oxidoreductase n=1 Tax=Pseudomonas sp. LP_7_YM TaxID=2485137 RepID=UPI00105BA9E5|nr:SDR family oxidoreductase [Pseudomonas sp. LP_7_YM]TDV66138.1 nucleoside-diphosphate-sugar epimerase [Pseudomonas sp. LP_7_YM]